MLDRVDVITDASRNPDGSCERVARKAPNPRDSAPEDSEEAPAEPSPSV